MDGRASLERRKGIAETRIGFGNAFLIGKIYTLTNPRNPLAA